ADRVLPAPLQRVDHPGDLAALHRGRLPDRRVGRGLLRQAALDRRVGLVRRRRGGRGQGGALRRGRARRSGRRRPGGAEVGVGGGAGGGGGGGGVGGGGGGGGKGGAFGGGGDRRWGRGRVVVVEVGVRRPALCRGGQEPQAAHRQPQPLLLPGRHLPRPGP